MPKRIAVLGGGSWGMAISQLLCGGGAAVTLWEFSPKDCERLKTGRSIPERLGRFRLDDKVTVTNNSAEALSGAELVVLATPSQHLRSVLQLVPGQIRSASAVVNLAKGIEDQTLLRMSEVITEVTGLDADKTAILSGPSHAEEVIQDVPTTVVAASVSDALASRVQELFSIGNFRVYKSDDIIGVEIGGSLKNIIAIAAGITDGLGLGDNTKGALITRGLAEITRLGMAVGARAETFAGLSGLGDLVTTCFSRHSRNRYVGDKIGQGLKLSEVLAGMTMVAEGVKTARSAWGLAARYGVEVPITEQVFRVLFEDKSPAQAVDDLMGRRLKAEIWR